MLIENTIAKFNYKLERGTTLEIEMQYLWLDEEDLDAEGKPIAKPIDLTDSTIIFDLKWQGGSYQGSSDVESDPVKIPEPEEGRVYILVSPALSDTMAIGTAHYRICRKVSDDMVKAISYGEIAIGDWA